MTPPASGHLRHPRRLAHVVALVLVALATHASASAGGGVEPGDHTPGPYRPPAPGVVLRLFDPPPVPWARGHRGVDLQAPPGAPVRAPQDGVVAFSGPVVDRGVISIDHPDGLRTSLEPVTDALDAGTPVTAGDVVGRVASDVAHCIGTGCVHWGVRRDGEYLDPLSLLAGTEPVVLLARDQYRSSSASVERRRSMAAVCI